MSDIDALARLHGTALEQLSNRARILADKESGLRADLERVVAERALINSERTILASAEQVYRRIHGWSEPLNVTVTEPTAEARSNRVAFTDEGKAALNKEPDVPEPQKPRARIGPQRFRMFHALRALGHTSIDELAVVTNLPIRRVKDQMGSDLASKNVSVTDGQYQLTELGQDLLTRYIEYKRSRNEPLPSLEAGEEERDDGEDEDQPPAEGAMTG